MLRLRALLFCLCLLLSLSSLAPAQEVGGDEPPSPNEVQLSARDVGAVFAAPGSATNLIEFQADPQGGGDVFDVVSSDARAAVSLILPDGSEVNGANAEALGFTYSTAPEGSFDNLMVPNFLSTKGTHTLIVLPPSAAPGRYKVKANLTAVTGTTDTVVVIASYFSSSTIRAGLRFDGQLRVGKPVLLSGLLFNDSAPVAGASVTAAVEDPTLSGDTQTTVAMLDSGGGADAAAGDGLYSGVFTPAHAGDYTVAMRATGTSPAGAAYSRVVTAVFHVTDPLASFGAFHDEGLDDDFNGLIDRVVITADVSVQKAGRYQFGLTLAAGNGNRVNATSFSNLQAGPQQVSVTFTSDDLIRLGVDGPYAMKDAILTFQDDPALPVADTRENAGNTAAYTLLSLNRPALYFTGQNSAQGVDTNGNGKYDALQIRSELLALYPGFYQWSGSLYDSFNHEIGFFSGGGFLNAGSNVITFSFDGSKIGRNGVNGPYSLRGVLIFGNGESNNVDELFSTQPFSYKEFEDSDNLRLGAVTASETAGDSDNFLEPGEDGSLGVRLSNVGATGMTSVAATLTALTPGVTVTGGQAAYPDLAANGSATNSAPFTFSLDPSLPCGQTLDFMLSVSASGDSGVPSILHFSVQTGQRNQTTVGYRGPAVAIPDGNTAGVNIPVTVSGFNGTLADLNFRIDGDSCSANAGATGVGIDHTWVGDLVIRLTSPQGTTVTLISRAGGGSFGSDGNNFCNTLLDDEGGGPSIQTIVPGGAPYTGTFTPASPLAAFRGQNPNGTWTLNVADVVSFDSGSVRAFSLVLSSGVSCADSAAPKTVATRVTQPNAAGWNNTDAAVAFSSADNKAGSGVRDITYSASGAQIVAPTTVPGPSTSLTVTAQGTTTVTFFARDNAGNTEAPQTLVVNVDKTAPVINISAPVNTAYALNQTVAARYTCSDGASGVSSCAGSVPDGAPVDTASVGAKTFNVTATDVAGNATTASVSYSVVSSATYRVRLLYDPTKASKIGSTIPVKIQIINDLTGQNVSSDALVVHALGVLKESDYAPGPVEDAGNANPDDDFRFNNFGGEGGYIYNLKTTGLTVGTYVLVFKVGNDPYTYGAKFQVK